MTVAKKPGHRGERGVSRKPLRREGRDASAEPVCSCAFFYALLHARPRVQRAPGFPCALLLLSRAAIDAKLGRIAPRECGRTSSRCMTIELEIHTHVVPDKRLVQKPVVALPTQPSMPCTALARPRGSACVAWMKRSEIRGLLVDIAIPDCAALHPGYSSMGGGSDTHQLKFTKMMGFAKGSTHPAYCKVLAAALARMRRYRSHHPHRSCGWLRQAKAAESLIAVPAFYFPAQRVGRISESVIRRRNSGAIRLAIAACAALLRGGIWLGSQLLSLHSAALMRATCSGFRKPS